MAKIYGDRWEVEKTIGEGGQAQVFLVTDKKGEGETRYVLKLLKNLNRIERFKGEVEAVRNLVHENIVRLIDYDLEAERPYLVTEYCSGGSLSQSERFWDNSPIEAFKIFQQVCEGVAYAHSQGVTHRDLKPDNIFLRTKHGPAVVGDFGICHLEGDGKRITLTEEAVGARLYMAPELEDGRLSEVSPKSDTYSLGKILYWLLSGGKVFSREKYREPEWDLKGQNPDTMLGWNNIYMEHVNRLLDYMIVADPNNRRSVHNILILSRQASMLVEKEFNPISKDIKQPCKYCGQGCYVLRVSGGNVSAINNFGLRAISGCDWRILACNMCGHIQIFRVDMAHQKDWWS